MFNQIEQKFGREVKNIVAECTDDKSLEKEERQRLQIEHTPHISKQVIMIFSHFYSFLL